MHGRGGEWRVAWGGVERKECMRSGGVHEEGWRVEECMRRGAWEGWRVKECMRRGGEWRSAGGVESGGVHEEGWRVKENMRRGGEWRSA